jgi:hypothetical protein
VYICNNLESVAIGCVQYMQQQLIPCVGSVLKVMSYLVPVTVLYQIRCGSLYISVTIYSYTVCK